MNELNQFGENISIKKLNEILIKNISNLIHRILKINLRMHDL